MKIKEISYDRRVSDGNFGSACVGVVTTVAEDENPDEVFNAVKTWVDDRVTGKPVKETKTGVDLLLG